MSKLIIIREAANILDVATSTLQSVFITLAYY